MIAPGLSQAVSAKISSLLERQNRLAYQEH